MVGEDWVFFPLFPSLPPLGTFLSGDASGLPSLSAGTRKPLKGGGEGLARVRGGLARGQAGAGPGQSATRRPAIQRRKLQASAPPIAGRC